METTPPYASGKDAGAGLAAADQDDDEEDCRCCSAPSSCGWDCEVDILSMDLGMDCKNLVVEAGVGRIERVGESNLYGGPLKKSDRPAQEDARKCGDKDIFEYPSGTCNDVSFERIQALTLKNEEDGVMDILTDEGDYTESVGTILPASDISLARFWDANQKQLYGMAYGDTHSEGQAPAARQLSLDGISLSASPPPNGGMDMQHHADLLGRVDSNDDYDYDDDDADNQADKLSFSETPRQAPRKTWAQLLEDDLAQGEGDYESCDDEGDDDGDVSYESDAETNELPDAEHSVRHGLSSWWSEEGVVAGWHHATTWWPNNATENSTTAVGAKADDSRCTTNAFESKPSGGHGYTLGGHLTAEGYPGNLWAVAAEEGSGSDSCKVSRTVSLSEDCSREDRGEPGCRSGGSAPEVASSRINEALLESAACGASKVSPVTGSDAAQSSRVAFELLVSALHSESAENRSVAITNLRQEATIASASWSNWQGDSVGGAASAASLTADAAASAGSRKQALPAAQDTDHGVPNEGHWLPSGPGQLSSTVGKPAGNAERIASTASAGYPNIVAVKENSGIDAAASIAGQGTTQHASLDADDTTLSSPSSSEGRPRLCGKQYSLMQLASSSTAVNGDAVGSEEEALPRSHSPSADVAANSLWSSEASSLSLQVRWNRTLLESDAHESKARAAMPLGMMYETAVEQRGNTGMHSKSTAQPQQCWPNGRALEIGPGEVDVCIDSCLMTALATLPEAHEQQQQQQKQLQQPANVASHTRQSMPSCCWPIDIRSYINHSSKQARTGASPFTVPADTSKANSSFTAAVAIVPAVASPFAIRAAVTQPVGGIALAGITFAGTTPVGAVRLCELEPIRSCDKSHHCVAGLPATKTKNEDLVFQGSAPSLEHRPDGIVSNPRTTATAAIRSEGGREVVAGRTGAAAASSDECVPLRPSGSDYSVDAQKHTAARGFLSAVLGRRMSNQPSMVDVGPYSRERPLLPQPPSAGSALWLRALSEAAAAEEAAEISGSRFVRPQVQAQQHPLLDDWEVDQKAAALAGNCRALRKPSEGIGGSSRSCCNRQQECHILDNTTVGSGHCVAVATASAGREQRGAAIAAIEASAVAASAGPSPALLLGVSICSSNSTSSSSSSIRNSSIRNSSSSIGSMMAESIGSGCADDAAEAPEAVPVSGWPQQPADEPPQQQPRQVWQGHGSDRWPPALAAHFPTTHYQWQQVGPGAAAWPAPSAGQCVASDQRDGRLVQVPAASSHEEATDLHRNPGLKGGSEYWEASAEQLSKQSCRAATVSTAPSWEAGIRELEEMYQRACWELEIGLLTADKKAGAIQP